MSGVSGGLARPVPAGSVRRRSLRDHVDHRSNGLNLVRLVLASSVIFWHSYPLTGRQFPFRIGSQFFGEFAVDGFFAISGFLLVGSWLHNPTLLTFLKNRVLRILPAFWVCLVITAFVFAPIAVLIQHGTVGTLFSGPHSSQMYVVSQLAIQVHFYDISGTPLNVPFPGAWNGSLWTLRWEFFAYLALAALGLIKVLNRRYLVLAMWLVLWAVNIALATDVLNDSYYVRNTARLGFMFMSGMIVYLFGRSIPANRWVPMGAALLLIAGCFLPDYRVIGAPALAYLVVWIGGAIHNPKLQLKDRDTSYGVYIYAFPIQQLLVVAGLVHLPALLFGLVSLAITLPLAAVSWVFIERPMLRLKRLKPRRRRPLAQPPDPADSASGGALPAQAVAATEPA